MDVRSRMSMSNILNDGLPEKHSDYSQPSPYTHMLAHRPRLTHGGDSFNEYRRSSYISSRSYSHSTTDGFPPTPELMRSDSSDSNEESGGRSPTPLTPVLPQSPSYNPFSSHVQTDHIRAAAALQSLGQAGTCFPPSQASVKSKSSTSRRSMSPKSTSYTSSTEPSAQTTRQYICPLAREYGCEKYFTTSGHARRHSRTHTGVRSSVCPECGQAFSRQDNMQQHRRTHRHGRQAAGTVPTVARTNSSSIARHGK